MYFFYNKYVITLFVGSFVPTTGATCGTGTVYT